MMKRLLVFVAVLVILVLVGALSSAVEASAYRQASHADPVVPCDVGAYVIDQDPRGLNVRSGPGKTFGVIGNLPRKEDTGVAVHITGSSGEWVRIDLSVEEGAEEERTFFKGDGWVYGPLLGVSGIALERGGTPLYQEPMQKARVITRVAGGDDATVRGCRGKWMYVDYKSVKGWAAPDTLCDNSLTTCA